MLSDMRRARFIILFLALLAGWGLARPSAETPAWLEAYREPARRIIEAATADRFAWDRLATLTDTFGHRLTGSKALEDAIDWVVAEMRADGLDAVWTDPVMAPHWVRGEESLEIVAPRRHAVPMLGLGMSVGTPPTGIEAELLVVDSLAELERRSTEAAGRIVLFNVAYRGYGPTVAYRTTGAVHAARHGAVAALVRSIGPEGLRTPHTGMLTYKAGTPRIPAAAIPLEDARRLARMADRGEHIRLRLTMGARRLPDVESANVIAELRGRERPDEIVLVGGHLDSWDVGTGASDDAGGCVAAWEVARLLKALDLVPRRTIRVVLFTNEENGLKGGLAYRDRYRDELGNHVLMIESDLGVPAPSGVGFSGNDTARSQIAAIASLLEPIGATRVGASGGGADIGPSVAAAGVPALSPEVDSSEYFVVHHTEADTVDRIDAGEMAKHVATLAVMAYVVADMPARLGDAPGTR
jgi:carboxypeptidase Q